MYRKLSVKNFSSCRIKFPEKVVEKYVRLETCKHRFGPKNLLAESFAV